MKLDGILPFARTLLQKGVSPGDIAIDATVGNGHDTLFLAQLVGEKGHVFGFDIQAEAIQKTTERLQENHCDKQVTLFQRSHGELKNYVPKEYFGKITGAT